MKLQRSRPDGCLDAAAVINFLDAVAAQSLELHSMMVLRHGEVAAEGWWAPYGPDSVHLLYSLSKSFTSAAAGFAMADGLFSWEDHVIDLWPEADPDEVGALAKEITIRNVASMATGHWEDTLERAVGQAAGDLVRGFLAVPPDQEPGTVFAYNNTATYVLGAITQRLTGENLSQWLKPRLFDPIGIDQARWATWGGTPEEPGYDIAFTGLHLTTEAVARFGQLLLDGGRVDGRQLLDPAWLELATSRQIRNDIRGNGDVPDPDWACGYGFQFWLSRHGFRGDGAYGQFCLVLPEVDAVVVLTSATAQTQDLLDAVWEHLLPGFGTTADPDEPAPIGADRHDELAGRLGSLELTPVATRIPPPDPVRSSRFASGAGNIAFPCLSGFSVAAGTGGWQLELTMETGTAAVTAGDGAWAAGTLPGYGGDVPVMTSAGWTGDGRFEVEMIMIFTPHRVHLVAEQADGDPTTSEFRSEWNLPPLAGTDPTHLFVADTLNPVRA